MILAAREAAEVRTGYTPTHVVIRQEIWTELSIDPYTEEISDLWEIGGMKVSVSDYLDNPYELLLNINSVE